MGSQPLTIQYAVGIFITVGLAILGYYGQRKLSDPTFIEGISLFARLRADRAAPLGLMVRGVARVLLAICGVVYLGTAVLVIASSLTVFAQDEIQIALEDITAGRGNLLTPIGLYLLQAPEAAYNVLMIVLVAVVGALAIDRLGKSMLARSASDVVTRDQRPPILFLRSFGDDKVRIRATRFSRRGVLGRFSLRRTRRFEEVVSWRIARFGPLVAVNDPGRRFVRLGAAKFTLAHDNWQAAVQDLAIRSLAVVVSAAPSELNDGLMWELGMLADPSFTSGLSYWCRLGIGGHLGGTGKDSSPPLRISPPSLLLRA